MQSRQTGRSVDNEERYGGTSIPGRQSIVFVFMVKLISDNFMEKAYSRKNSLAISKTRENIQYLLYSNN
jgi:hypothetical protein